MIMKNLLSLLVLCSSLFGCAHNVQPISNVDSQAAKVPAVAKSDTLSSKAVFDLKGWTVKTNLEGAPVDSQKATRILLASKDYTSYQVILTAAVLPTQEESESFSVNMVKALLAKDGVELIDYSRVSIGKTSAILALETRETRSGSVVFIYDLFFADGALGYAVSCGGPGEKVKEWNADCAKALGTMQLKP